MDTEKIKVLILGATGMLGSAVFNRLSQASHLDVWATLRNTSGKHFFSDSKQSRLIANVDVLDNDALICVMKKTKPDVVINCVGLIKQFGDANNPLIALPLNAILPHRLANLCALTNARLVHISTDCVFNGRKGMYTEDDIGDAEDLYGKSKHIGELHDLPNAITLRTSVIGHELNSHTSLVDWFLTQTGPIKGYRKTIFSGLTTIELANIIKEIIIPNNNLHGLYHISAEPINKYKLLNLIAEIYGKEILIEADDQVQVNRSLDSNKFRRETGYKPPTWPQLIEKMYLAHKEGGLSHV